MMFFSCGVTGHSRHMRRRFRTRRPSVLMDWWPTEARLEPEHAPGSGREHDGQQDDDDHGAEPELVADLPLSRRILELEWLWSLERRNVLHRPHLVRLPAEHLALVPVDLSRSSHENPPGLRVESNLSIYIY